MNNLYRKMQVKHGVFFENIDWILNIYVIQGNTEESISWTEVYSIAESVLNDIENNCLSDEFTYFRTGFAFAHYGKRGIDFSVWHVGKWGETYEIFKRVWYCYNREVDAMEVLDDAEPVLSQYEIKYLSFEFDSIISIIQKLEDNMDFRKQYVK